MHTRQHPKAKRAFTLIEILIVVVILGILAAIIIPQFSESAEAARDNAANSTLQTVRAQVELYKFKEGACPASLDDMVDDGYLIGNSDGEFAHPDGYTIELDTDECTVSMTAAGEDG